MSRIIKQSSNDYSTLDPALNESVELNIAQLDARSIITLRTTSFRQIAKPTPPLSHGLNHGCAIHHVSVSICYPDRSMCITHSKLIVNLENMDVIKPLDLTPLFDRTPHGPPIKLAIQRHCSYNLANFTHRSTFNPDRPPVPPGRYLLRYVQCTVFFVQCWYLVKS